jgi:hypothetical protein
MEFACCGNSQAQFVPFLGALNTFMYYHALTFGASDSFLRSAVITLSKSRA